MGELLDASKQGFGNIPITFVYERGETVVLLKDRPADSLFACKLQRTRDTLLLQALKGWKADHIPSLGGKRWKRARDAVLLRAAACAPGPATGRGCRPASPACTPGKQLALTVVLIRFAACLDRKRPSGRRGALGDKSALVIEQRH